MTSGRGMMAATKGAPPHDWLGNTGGSIGIALPLAVGAAVACPDGHVLCLTADGSGMYTLQALWTMAREAEFPLRAFASHTTTGSGEHVTRRIGLSIGIKGLLVIRILVVYLKIETPSNRSAIQLQSAEAQLVRKI